MTGRKLPPMFQSSAKIISDMTVVGRSSVKRPGRMDLVEDVNERRCAGDEDRRDFDPVQASQGVALVDLKLHFDQRQTLDTHRAECWC